MGYRQISRMFVVGTLGVALLVTTAPQDAAMAAPTVVVTRDAVALGRALAADTSWVTGASFLAAAGSTSSALVAGGIAGMPTSGQQATLLSTGDATLITA